MTDFPILRDLGFILVTAAAVLLVARTVRVPPILAYMVAGLVLGPLTGLIHETEGVHLISEVGIALLLFLVGLELSLDKIRDVGRVAVVAGLGQVVFTAAVGFGITLLLGFPVVESVFIATALTFSSTVVVVKVLTQKRELDTLYGRIGVGIFLVQDLVVIVALTVLTGLGRPEDLTAMSLLGNVGGAFGGMLLLLGVALLASRYLLPRLFGWMAPSPEGLLIWSLSWCFLFVIGAERLGVSPEIGAFLAGVSLAQLSFNEELRRRVHPLMNFFLMVFFVSLGVQMELGAAGRNWFPAIVLSLFVLIGNPLIFILIIARMGYARRTAFLTSVTVAQISEFSFVFAAVGLSAGLIDESVLSLIGVVGLVTIGTSVYMILYNHELYAFMERRGWLRVFGGKTEEEKEAAPDLADHVIVVGMNTLGRRVVEALVSRGEKVLAVDTDPAKLRGLPPCAVLVGNTEYPSVLEEAHLKRAKLLVSALQIEEANNLLAYRGRRAGVPSSIHAFDPILMAELREYGATHLMVSKHDGIRQVAEALREEGVIA